MINDKLNEDQRLMIKPKMKNESKDKGISKASEHDLGFFVLSDSSSGTLSPCLLKISL